MTRSSTATGPRLPEGLAEMAQSEETVDREDVAAVYDELLAELADAEIDRRTLLSVFAGGGGLAVLTSLFAQRTFVGDDAQSGLEAVLEASDGPPGVRYVDDPTYEVDDDVYERPPNETDFRFRGAIARWIDESDGGVADEGELLDRGLETAETSYAIPNPANEAVEAADPGLGRANRALEAALGSVSGAIQGFRFGRTDDRLDIQKHVAEGSGFATRELVDREPTVEDPDRLRSLLGTVARLAGCADVGVGELDERWIYSHRGDGAPIVFEDVDEPVLDDDRTVIPERFDRVVVGVSEMPLSLTRTSPTPVSAASGALGYSRMATGAVALATWIRAMGYGAIPALNDTGLSVPMAIDAGLGEAGRHGRLIHPQFGSNVRLFKVLTDMPATVDPYVEFGVGAFCETCRICVENCPSNTIPYGSRTWEYEGEAPSSWRGATDEPWDSTKANGVRKWYEKPKTCLRFWMENGSSCSNCIVTCPFTQGRGRLAELFTVLAGRSERIDRQLVDLAGGHASGRSAFGDVGLHPPETAWDRTYLPYGLSQDPDLPRE
ncbi:reductive dehalogenase [Halalkaliarchaeum desulfuricum]|uniref:Reductive dehalogenase n=1 Tax=Halalkaliarchaeum desulfuricum TaxID=2055893 RepID=A0A343TNQ6_9EURY|nr:reductive dehalogenase [Halalkaliarchaeum desulfuricum]